MACKADLETIDDDIKESTSILEQASQSTDRFFSIKETSSMDEGFNSFEQSTMNTTDKFFTPKKTESTDLLEVMNSVGSKRKDIAKSLQHLDFSARHSTPQKYLNKTALCQDMKRRLDEFSPVKSHSLENEIDTHYPYTNTDLGLSPRAIRSNADTFKAFFENYTYDTFKQVMKIMKKSHMTAAEAKLRMVIDEMEKAINKSVEDCTEPIATQMLRHINESKRCRNQSLKANVTVKDHEEDVFKPFFENYTYDTFKEVMKIMKKSHMTAAEAKLRMVIDEMEKAINKSMEDCTEPIATQVLRHINETKILRRTLNPDVTVNDQEEDISQKPSEDAKEDNVSQNSNNDNEEILKAEYDIKPIPVPKGETLLPKDNVNRFPSKWKRNKIPASDSDEVTKNLTYQILTDFQTLAGIASYNTTLDGRDLVKRQIRYRYSSYANTQNGQKFIRKHIHINEQIIKQITKLMKFAFKRQPSFLGSFAHLEGERIFLLAKTRRDALINNLYKVPKPVNEPSATIIVEKLACRIIISENLSRLNLNTFFLCILEHKDTVYSTTATVLDTRGWIDFEGRFSFENVSNRFNIKVSVYSLTIKTATPSCVLNFAFLRRRPQLPMMSLIGVAEIGLLNAKYQTFSLRNAENVLRPDYKLYAAVGVNLNWPSAFKTFLTVGSTRTDKEPTWTRKWCVLEDGQMNFYASPSDEMFSDPIKIVDVRECQSVKGSPIKYYNTSALMLVFNDDPEDKLFLSADTEDDVSVLFDKIKGILKLKHQWIKLKK